MAITFQLTTAGSSGTLPYTIGLGFKKGDIPDNPAVDSATYQVVVKRRWNDNSAKHAIVSGTAALTSTVAATFTVTNSTGTSSGGTDLTATDIQTAAPSASVQCGSIGTVSLASLLATPFRTWISGPDMVECHYRSQIGTDTSLNVWFHVRLWAGGTMWVRAIVENGYVNATTANKSYVPTIIIGGVTVYNNGGATLSHYAYTRYSAERWVGTDPQITPTHDTTYLPLTKLVPNYWKRNPAASALNALAQTYTPMSNGGLTASMGNAGFQNQLGILPLWDALYATSGDPRAYRSVLANSSHLNSYPIVWRDANTNLVAKPSDHPTFSIGGGTFNLAAGSLTWEMNHAPSEGYTAYLLTGDYWHYETMLMNTALNYLAKNFGAGSGVNRILTAETRGTAWNLRTLAQLAGLFPTGDVVATEYQTLLANNMTYWSNIITSTLGGVGIGYIYSYGAYGPGVEAPWQQHFMIMSVGAGSDLEPLASMTTYNAVRDFLYKAAVGITGDSSGYCFNYAANYNINLGTTSATTNPATWFTTWAEAWAYTYSASGIIPPGPPPSCTNTLQGSSGSAPNEASTGYWGNFLPTIAYAVDHAATGAAASWARLIGATNWSTIESGQINSFDNIPIWGIVPRASEAPSLLALVRT